MPLRDGHAVLFPSLEVRKMHRSHAPEHYQFYLYAFIQVRTGLDAAVPAAILQNAMYRINI